MNRRFLFLAIVLCAAITLFAQAKKDVLCVYNFTYSSNVGSNYAEMLRNTVIDGINKTGRLKIVDTKNDEIMKAEISRRMGISRQAYQRLEDPKSSLSVSTLIKLAEALGKNLEVRLV